MKQSWILIACLSLAVSFSGTKYVNATPPVPSTLSECMAPVPDIPALPETETLYGDVNGDGMVNVLDLIAIVTYIMGGSPDPFDLEAADLNGDGIVNILDVVFNVNIILGVPGIPCPGIPAVTYEGQIYNTVSIGAQCWFRENLNIGTFISSTTSGYLQTDNDIIEKYCYDNDIANCALYGGLYEWGEAMQYETTGGSPGICPPGWHVPTDNEWKILEGTVDSQYPVGDPVWDNFYFRGLDAGGNLKKEGIDDWFSPNTGATNVSGFTGLPGGSRNGNWGTFNNLHGTGIFWTSSQNDQANGWYHSLEHSNAGVYRDWRYKAYGFSVRCLKGCSPQPTQADAGPDQLNIPGTSATLAGNTPASGTGMWEIMSGTGGTISNPVNPTSVFQGIAGNVYALSWTITTICGSSTDQVTVSFACSPQPTPANAGPDQPEVPGTSTTLAGNTPEFGEGLWAIVSGTGGTINNPNSPTSEFQGLADNEYTLSWTISTVCGSSADAVTISFAPGMEQPCQGISTISYYSQTYNTVEIGSQCWLKENLNVGTMISSNSGGQLQTNNGVIEKYCYQNNTANCAIYGGLYEWKEAMQYVTTEGAQGICPEGWHIPTDNEIKILEGTVDSQYPVGDPVWDNLGWRGLDAGGNLKEEGTTHWNPPNTDATNSSGFTALPAGYRYQPNGTFSSIGNGNQIWCSSEYVSNTTFSWSRNMTWTTGQISRAFIHKETGISVRCLKDL